MLALGHTLPAFSPGSKGSLQTKGLFHGALWMTFHTTAKRRNFHCLHVNPKNELQTGVLHISVTELQIYWIWTSFAECSQKWALLHVDGLEIRLQRSPCMQFPKIQYLLICLFICFMRKSACKKQFPYCESLSLGNKIYNKQQKIRSV